MAEEVFMDIPQVQKLAQAFGTFGETLQAVSKALEAAITILKVTAFVGLVGGAAVEAYLNMIKPRVDQLAAKMHELQGDVNGAISNYQTGDTSGSRRFR
jgi:outer membrane murein-binding lipoprotein Lpp